MKKYLVPVILLAMASLFTASCGKNNGDVAAVLGHGFPLAIGQTAMIDGEELEIKFIEILEDSRCPAGAQCVWEGRVSARVEFKDSAGSYKMVLVQSGSDSGYVEESYKDYLISYKITPYPQQNEEIEKQNYRLLLTIHRDQ
ncbi:MAG: hypothetical protein WCS74_00440 [Dehalococcoidales bacterium]|jgi:hypothetical protein|nr:hypothetical protein [Limnochordia bacterium]MDD2252467.1 hypothetical protein [Dehalococcoidales bacterium]MDD3265186.1 hypothetical protein [Dehalococcoidales bacterium]MDD4322247.1 hypothetical protein [Dehalococcoidales bacterium]MDD4794425.1 hypothetical protein [Dehalococcoidales bacterium]